MKRNPRRLEPTFLRCVWVGLLSVLIPIFMPVRVPAASAPDWRAERRSSSELIGSALSYIDADTLLDKAVINLSVVANRYYAHTRDSAARRDAIRAMYNLGNIYSLRLFDFPKAYTNLSTARMLAEEEHDYHTLANILLSLANVYTVCYENSERTSQLVNDLIFEALDCALKGDNQDAMARIAINFGILRVREKGWGPYTEKVKEIRAYRFPASSLYGKITTNVVAALDAYFKGNYAETERRLEFVLGLRPDRSFRERFSYGVMYILQYVYENQGRYDDEYRLLLRRLKLSRDLRLQDYELYTYSHLVHFFERRNQPDSVKKYEILYLYLQEEMNQNAGMDKIGKIEMQRQIEKTNDEVRELSLQRQRDHRHLTVTLAVIVVGVLALLMLAYMYVSLKRNHRLLFRRNTDLLKEQEHYRLMLRDTEDAPAGPASETAPPDAPAHSEEADLPDEEMERLFTRILKVMEENRDIYTPGFGIDSLAELLHVPARSVSRAINVKNGTNFHTFLNAYRIREACRLMQTTDAASHTVEYISESVGFRSRTSFASLFKKSTGLTPSEYWRMSAGDNQSR